MILLCSTMAAATAPPGRAELEDLQRRVERLEERLNLRELQEEFSRNYPYGDTLESQRFNKAFESEMKNQAQGWLDAGRQYAAMWEQMHGEPYPYGPVELPEGLKDYDPRWKWNCRTLDGKAPKLCWEAPDPVDPKDDGYEIRFNYTTELNPGPCRAFRCTACGVTIPWHTINQSKHRPMHIERRVLDPGTILVAEGLCSRCIEVPVHSPCERVAAGV